MLGVKVVAEHSGDRRARLILSLVGASWIALLGFALLPARFGPLCLFLNGLPLGMIWASSSAIWRGGACRNCWRRC